MTESAKNNGTSSESAAVPSRTQWAAKWYATGPPDIKPEARQVLEKYSKIRPEDIDTHVQLIRDKAWNIHPYPCIGQWRFLDLAIGEHSQYAEIVDRMRSGEQVFLDLGCAFAQDIRKLVADGVDSGQCYGSDLRLDYIELGYDLFRDKDSLKSKFIEADIFDPDSSLKELHGKVDIIGASSFFHLFSWDEQKKVAHRVVKLMKQQSGSLLVGRQVGSNEPAEKARRDGSGSRYRHNLESWKKMWQEVSHETGVRFDVDGLEIQLPEKFAHFREIGDLALQFTVRRV